MDQRSELILGFITHVSKVTITSGCSVRAHQVQMRNLGSFWKAVACSFVSPLILFLCFFSIFYCSNLVCVLRDLSEGYIKKNLLNK